MIIVKPSATIIAATSNLQEVIELCGRKCWKSEEKIEPGSSGPFIERIKGFKHESVMEHGAITVSIICDRGVSHELVRHRIASFSQESTRYCNYSKDKFVGQLFFIDPRGAFWKTDGCDDETAFRQWKACMEYTEATYMQMINNGCKPQEARSILPNSLKTDVAITANPREWRHIFHLRCDRAAHPQMREIMLPLHKQFADLWPAIFADVEYQQ